MRATNRSRREWRLFFGLSIGSALISAWFGYSQNDETTSLHSALVGVAASIIIASPIMLLELKGQRTVLRRARRLPLLAYLGLKIAFYMAIILGGLFLVRALNISTNRAFDAAFGNSILFAVAMSVATNLVFEIGGLLGYGTVKNLLLGRYVHPRKEQRAFLLLDMKDSTGMAERLGPVKVPRAAERLLPRRVGCCHRMRRGNPQVCGRRSDPYLAWRRCVRGRRLSALPVRGA